MNTGTFLLGLVIGFSFGLGFISRRLWERVFRRKPQRNYDEQIFRFWMEIDEISRRVSMLEKFQKKIEQSEDDGR